MKLLQSIVQLYCAAGKTLRESFVSPFSMWCKYLDLLVNISLPAVIALEVVVYSRRPAERWVLSLTGLIRQESKALPHWIRQTSRLTAQCRRSKGVVSHI